MADKAQTRKEILAKRAALLPEEHLHMSQIICHVIASLREWQQANSILFFLPFRDEVNIDPLLPVAWGEGKRVLAPRCLPRTRALVISEIKTLDHLAEGTWGIREPLNSLPAEDPQNIDLILVPGVAFDAEGGRLDYGGGYYDRFLPACRHDAIRLAPHFSLQLIGKIATGEHDEYVDMLINELQIIETSQYQAKRSNTTKTGNNYQ